MQFKKLTRKELEDLQVLLNRASANDQFKVVDPTQSEFYFDFVMTDKKGNVKLTIDWKTEGALPEVAQIAVNRVRAGMDPMPGSEIR